MNTNELKTLLDKARRSAGYRELSILADMECIQFRKDGTHQIMHVRSNDGHSCEYAIDLERWTN